MQANGNELAVHAPLLDADRVDAASDAVAFAACHARSPCAPSGFPAAYATPRNLVSPSYSREDKIGLILLRMRLRVQKRGSNLPMRDPMCEDGLTFRACRDSVLDELFELSGKHLASERRTR